MESRERLELTFGGENKIALSTLTTSLEATLDILKKIADKYIRKDEFIRFNIKEARTGSFEIVIEIVKIVTETLLGVATLITPILFDIFKVRKHLKAAPPKETKIDKTKCEIIITNKEGNAISIREESYSLYTQDNDIENAFAKLSKATNSDKERTTITLKTKVDDGNFQVLEYNAEDVKMTSTTMDAETFSNDFEEYTNPVKLRVRKACFSGDAKWEFFNTVSCTNILADILDKNFLDKVRKGKEPIFGTTLLNVLLLTRRKIDSEKPIFHVLKVFDAEKIEVEEQTSFIEREP